MMVAALELCLPMTLGHFQGIVIKKVAGSPRISEKSSLRFLYVFDTQCATNRRS